MMATIASVEVDAAARVLRLRSSCGAVSEVALPDGLDFVALPEQIAPEWDVWRELPAGANGILRVALQALRAAVLICTS